MSDGDALLLAILTDPADDLVRLVYADWLEENGRAERARYVRGAMTSPPEPEIDDGPRGWRHELEAAIGLPAEWLLGREGPGELIGAGAQVGVWWSRGFIRKVALAAPRFTEENARWLFERYPITEVVLADREPDRCVWKAWQWACYGMKGRVELLAPTDEIYFHASENTEEAMFAARAKADSALSRACVDWGRVLVGLPRLPWARIAEG